MYAVCTAAFTLGSLSPAKKKQNKQLFFQGNNSANTFVCMRVCLHYRAIARSARVEGQTHTQRVAAFVAALMLLSSRLSSRFPCLPLLGASVRSDTQIHTPRMQGQTFRDQAIEQTAWVRRTKAGACLLAEDAIVCAICV